MNIRALVRKSAYLTRSDTYHVSSSCQDEGTPVRQCVHYRASIHSGIYAIRQLHPSIASPLLSSDHLLWSDCGHAFMCLLRALSLYIMKPKSTRTLQNKTRTRHLYVAMAYAALATGWSADTVSISTFGMGALVPPRSVERAFGFLV